MHPLLKKMTGGDRRSIGKSDEVVVDILSRPHLFKVVFKGMLVNDPLLRMRCADAAEKVTAQHPEYLHPYKSKLIEEIAAIEQQEVRWHAAQMLPRLTLSAKERLRVFFILLGYLEDKSKIVKTFSMQALADIAEKDPRLQQRVIPLIEELTRTGSGAMNSRGRKILKKIKKHK